MGVTIHYRGRLTDIQDINPHCDELTIVAEKMGWAFTRLDEDWSKPANTTIEVTQRGSQIVGHLPLKGIQLTPHPRCEAVQFYFDSDGRMCGPVSMVMISEGTLQPEDVWVSVKTQFAGPETHIWIVGLLKYLKEHYIRDLEVEDEGEYWKTGNLHTLTAKMELINEKIDMFSNELSRINRDHIDKFSADELASMIEMMVRDKLDLKKK
jgi:hypothetical protein